MTLDLLEKIFQNLEMTLTLEEATEKGRLFWDCVTKYLSVEVIQDNFEDYWIQLSREWDLNICDGGMFGDGTSPWQMCLYKVERDKNGHFVTDTLYQFISI